MHFYLIKRTVEPSKVVKNFFFLVSGRNIKEARRKLKGWLSSNEYPHPHCHATYKTEKVVKKGTSFKMLHLMEVVIIN